MQCEPEEATDALSGLADDVPLLPPPTTSASSPGARFWGQVRGSLGRLRVLQGKSAAEGETSQIAGKALYQARFPHHLTAGRGLHGREGVDGSSPSEGFKKRPAYRRSLLSVPALAFRWRTHFRPSFSRASRITASAGRLSVPASSSITCAYVASIMAGEWPACCAISTTLSPSAISSEQNACRRSYGRDPSSSTASATGA
jgi:hypothetical protein